MFPNEPLNAKRAPSGDHTALNPAGARCVTAVLPVPSAFMTWISEAGRVETNTIRSSTCAPASTVPPTSTTNPIASARAPSIATRVTQCRRQLNPGD